MELSSGKDLKKMSLVEEVGMKTGSFILKAFMEDLETYRCWHGWIQNTSTSILWHYYMWVLKHWHTVVFLRI